jgi:hypothetical protein
VLLDARWHFARSDCGALFQVVQAYRERSTGMVFLCKEKSDRIMNSPRRRSLVQKIGRG